MALELELPNLRAAVRHLIYTDRLDDAADVAWSLLIYWWLSGSFAEVRLWMLELLGKEQPITAHTRAAATFFVLWGELWQHPSDQMVAGLGECVRLFTESGDEEAAAMAIGRTRDGAHAVPRSRRRRRRRRAERRGRDPARPRQHVGRGDRRGLARPPRVGDRPDRRRARALRPRDRDRAGRRGPVHRRRRGHPAVAAELPPRRGRDRRGGVRRAAAAVDAAALRGGHRIRPRGHVRRRGDPRRRRGAPVRCPRRRRRSASGSACSTSRRSWCTRCRSRPSASATPRGWPPASAPAPTSTSPRRSPSRCPTTSTRRTGAAREDVSTTRRVAHERREGGRYRREARMTVMDRPVIRTPDQRLRVFVSSTLRELADERRAARVGHRAPAPRTRHVRARRPPAPAPRALPLVPRAVRRVRRHLRRELRLGRPRRGGLRPRGRVQPRARHRCPSSSTSRRPSTATIGCTS